MHTTRASGKRLCTHRELREATKGADAANVLGVEAEMSKRMRAVERVLQRQLIQSRPISLPQPHTRRTRLLRSPSHWNLNFWQTITPGVIITPVLLLPVLTATGIKSGRSAAVEETRSLPS